MQIGLTLENKISTAIAPTLDQLGYDLVKVMITSSGDLNILRIMIDRNDGSLVNIDDCEKASRQVSAILDVEDFISTKYTLELSSPGIDRPLTRLKDFVKYKGLEAKVEVVEKINGVRKFRGRIKNIEGETTTLAANVVNIDTPEQGKDNQIEFNNIKNAKLVLNDELLSMHKSNNI